MNEIENSIRKATLIARHLQQQLSTEEQAELYAWCAEKPENQQLFEALTNEDLLKESLQQLESISVEDGWKKVNAAVAPKAAVVPMHSSKRKWWIAAAAIAMLGGLWLVNQLTQNKNAIQPQAISKQQVLPDIAPGSDKAILTLADGSMIELDSTGNGEVASQGKVKIIKIDGKLAYTATGTPVTPVYNTISTPRGGQYQIELADGSKVWLNAASSIRFPAAFSGAERVVEMTGECYFEVAQNKKQPFRVKINQTEVLVTGTHFNVNGYLDEAIQRITLAEGSVQVFAGKSMIKLTPGQQANADVSGNLNLVKNADLDEVLAWKEGAFIFNSADVQTIMRQMSRWYSVDVVYQGNLSKETFSGMVSRQSNISRILKIMEAGGVKFKTEGNKIIVFN